MKYIIFFSEATPNPDLLGGKGSNIIKLYELNINVPPGFIITTNSYNKFLKESENCYQLIQLLENDLNPKVVLDLSKKIKDLMLKIQIPSEIIEELKQAYGILCKETDSTSSFAVRSSANIEDSSTFSFAGQAETYLYNNSFDDILESLKNCWISLFSPQALLYINQMKKKGITFSLLDIQMAVIIQKMVNSQISGVLFTANVINNNKNEMLINSTWGLGETIANNMIIPDTFIINKKEFEIIKAMMGKKEKIAIKNPHGSHTILIETEPKSKVKYSLSEEQLRQLHKLGLTLENRFNYPQDIEWAIEKDVIYTLQTRPITTLKK